ncbi:MAG: hypothetical protein LBO65_05595 [Spirochaetaceae bacterium]|jgi:hypothetical protein|nr:hypothetical protein [Spirochaetaceae bacterium]
MRKRIVFGAVAAVTMGILISCGDKGPSEVLISTENVHISGEGSKYLKVAAGDYTLKKIDKEILSITVKMEATQTLDRDEFISGKEDAVPGGKIGFDDICLVLTDAEGAVIDTYTTLSPDDLGRAKLQDLLTGNHSEALITFKTTVYDKKDLRNLLGTAAGFELANADITYEAAKKSLGETSSEVIDGIKNTASDVFGSIKDTASGLFDSESSGGPDTPSLVPEDEDEGSAGSTDLEGSWVDLSTGLGFNFKGNKMTVINTENPLGGTIYTFSINTRKKTLKLTDQFGDTEVVQYALNGGSLGIKDSQGNVYNLLRL